MKRILSLTIVLLFSVMAVDAQLKVNSLGKVGIATGTNTLEARLSVGWNNYFNVSNTSIGLVATPKYDNQRLIMSSSETLEKSPGPVKIERGGGLVINSNNVVIEDDFEVKLGGTLEIR